MSPVRVSSWLKLVLIRPTDSLAGQMAALKGGEAPTKKPRRKKAIETADDMSSDSGTDEEDSDSDTDTDTDTSDEE